ncbi:MAG: glycosyltransferase [Holosporales bacterium]|jgi:glycosyltransferase involved in cell wall biosynthesis|nr:glycosyltransferase [Holosporales bacterium]
MYSKLSVIVPIYNAEKYLKDCLDSLINQSFRNMEIILVDDGSTDNSYDICKEYSELDDRITIIRQKNQKQGAARNRGMEAATGKYVGFVDSDDYVDLNYFETLIKAARKHNADMTVSSVVKIKNNKRKTKWRFKTEETFCSDFDKFIVCSQNKNLSPWNKIYKKEFLEKYKIKFPEGVFFEDGLFTVKAVHYANRFVSVPNVVYFYRKNPNSTINSKQTEKHKTDAVNAKKEILKFIREHNVNIPPHSIHFTKSMIKALGIPIYSVKENIKYEILYIFGIIPVFWKKINDFKN